MKKIILLHFVLILFTAGGNAQSVAGEQLAERIAIKMRDSLSLSNTQKDSIYAINLRLLQQSRAVWNQSLPADSSQVRLQQIENSRDRQYQPVLGNEKYLLYKQKKKILVYSN